MTGKGDLGALRVGYQRAATLRGWHLTFDGNERTLATTPGRVVATVDKVDSFWLTQTPVDIGLYIGNCQWWIWEKVHIPDHRTIRPGTRIEIELEGKPLILPRFVNGS